MHSYGKKTRTKHHIIDTNRLSPVRKVWHKPIIYDGVYPFMFQFTKQKTHTDRAECFWQV